MAFSGRIKELVKKYGKVAIGVHVSRLLRLDRRPLCRHQQQRRRRSRLPQIRHLPRRRRGWVADEALRDARPAAQTQRCPARRPGAAAAQPDGGARGVERRRAHARGTLQ
ncbi:hypothetical protein HU200_013610 [Digitaria exilis]|uniref:Uncharacterized protein n=1 Tax=Digitaria exilis TaxID=1010633 RepID=A0A835FCS5_9POAL|nr:hypothetical protein HU200_013610 [Digitaria exilis]